MLCIEVLLNQRGKLKALKVLHSHTESTRWLELLHWSRISCLSKLRQLQILLKKHCNTLKLQNTSI